MKAVKLICSLAVVSFMAVTLPAFAGGTVKVKVKEWGIAPDRKSISAGKVTFVVKNLGEDTHELEIVKLDGDKKHNTLPPGPHMSVDEKWLVPLSLGEAEDIGSGKSKSFSVKLKPGRYALLCNMVETESDGSIEAHYMMGMSTAFTVK
jgi:uncharacterized cupredoxin-like copper-binding protein